MRLSWQHSFAVFLLIALSLMLMKTFARFISSMSSIKWVRLGEGLCEKGATFGFTAIQRCVQDKSTSKAIATIWRILLSFYITITFAGSHPSGCFLIELIQSRREPTSTTTSFLLNLNAFFLIISNIATLFDCIWANVFTKYRRWVG